MSIDVLVHAPGDVPLSPARLSAAMARKRWRLLILEKGTPRKEPDAPLQTGPIYEVFGAPSAAVLEDASRILLARRRGKLDPLFAKKGLNAVYLSIGEPDGEDAPLAGRLEKAVRAAQLVYLVNGHGGPLQWALWETIGTLTGGILSDPQSGDFKKAPPAR